MANNRQRKRAPIHMMEPKADRIVAAISYLIREATVLGYNVTQYDVNKSLFLADRAHLNKFGRPITFDNYVAMKNGPVPSLSYDFLKGDGHAIQRHNVVIPWTRIPAPEIAPNAYSFAIASERVQIDALSPSDVDELKSALIVVKSLGYSQVRRLTHQDPAYIEAWDDESEKKSFDISLSLMFDIPNESVAEHLSFVSKHM